VRLRAEPRSLDGFVPGGEVSTDSSREGFLELRYRSCRAKDSEHLSAGRRVDCQPYLSVGSYPGHVFCRALPKGICAATLESVGREADGAVTGDQTASCEAPSVPAGSSDGEHTEVIGRYGRAL